MGINETPKKRKHKASESKRREIYQTEKEKKDRKEKMGRNQKGRQINMEDRKTVRKKDKGKGKGQAKKYIGRKQRRREKGNYK